MLAECCDAALGASGRACAGDGLTLRVYPISQRSAVEVQALVEHLASSHTGSAVCEEGEGAAAASRANRLASAAGSVKAERRGGAEAKWLPTGTLRAR